MTSCRRCWPPMWPRRWPPKEWLGQTKAPDLVYICECTRVSVVFAGASTCILVHLTPKSWGRRGWLLGGYFLFHCSVRVTDRTFLCESTNIAHLCPSQLIDQLAPAGAGQSIDLVTIIIHFLPCIASRTSQTGPATTLLTMYFSSQYCRQYPQEIFSTILSTTYFLSGLCVWRIYVYFLIICYDIWRYIS